MSSRMLITARTVLGAAVFGGILVLLVFGGAGWFVTKNMILRPVRNAPSTMSQTRTATTSVANDEYFGIGSYSGNYGEVPLTVNFSIWAKNILYTIDFGDGEQQDFQGPLCDVHQDRLCSLEKFKHTYNSIGTYQLGLKDMSGVISTIKVVVLPKNSSVDVEGSMVTIKREGLSFDLPSDWAIVSSTPVAPFYPDDPNDTKIGTAMGLTDAHGKLIGSIECPPAPKGYEGDYGILASSSRSFEKNNITYKAGYTLMAGYDMNGKPDPNRIYGFFSGLNGGGSLTGLDGRVAECMTIAGSPLSQEDINGLISIYNSWR